MLHEVSFTSYNERDQVQAWIYVPACKPNGIVQLIHGFGEHSRRYIHMISAFLDAGYIVAADDHVGHGKTAMVNNVWGDWGDKGCHTMMEDEHTLKKIVCEKYPNLPYFLFGHSMGSFITRDFIAKYGNELNGATICGTTGIFRGAKDVKEKLKEIIDAGHGEESDPNIVGSLLRWMSDRWCAEQTGNEWICQYPSVQKDHAQDPFDAFTRPTSNRSIYDFIQMMLTIEGTQWAKKVPKKLPIYNIAGDQDPVGEYGLGVCQVSNWLVETGHHVTTKLYSGYRHEIHNYPEIKNEVETGIIEFMNSNL